MKLNKYIPDGKNFQLMANCRQVGAARILLEAVEIKRDEIRTLNELKPQICDEDISRDIRFNLGIVWALNWVLRLPGVAREVLSKLPDN